MKRAAPFAWLVVPLTVAGCDPSSSAELDATKGAGGRMGEVAAGASGLGGTANAGAVGGLPSVAGGAGSGGVGGSRVPTSTAVGGTDSGSGGASAGSASAGQPGSAGQSAGGAASTGAGCVGQHVFCDDFEAEKLKNLWQEEHSAENGAELSSSFAHSGKRSFHFTMNAPANGGGYAHLTTQAPFGMLGQHYFGRAFLFVDALPSGGVHVNYLTGRGPLPSGQTASYSYGLSDSNLMANYFVLDPWQDFWLNSNQKLPTGRWVCVEWEFDRNQNTMRQWLDGAAVSDQTIIGESACCPGKPWTAPERFAEQVLGWDYYQTSQTKHFNVWLDDVVLDSQRVGCGG